MALSLIRNYAALLSLGYALCASANAASPVSYYASYLGGSKSDTPYAIRSDKAGNLYIVGNTFSSYFDGFSSINPVKGDAFVSKIPRDGVSSAFTVLIGGSQEDIARDIVIDDEGFIYIAGETRSSDMPLSVGARQYAGGWDSFAAKLDPVSGEVIFLTYYGGSADDYAHGIAVDQAGNIFIAGETTSNDLPTTASAFIEDCLSAQICNDKQENSFVAEFDTRNASFPLAYGSYIGGSGRDRAHAIALGSLGHIHIVGETNSPDFPLKNQTQNKLRGELDGFYVRIDTRAEKNASYLVATYIGGSGMDDIVAITLDPMGNAYFTGNTDSPDFPVTASAFNRNCGTGSLPCNNRSNPDASHTDIFVAKLAHDYTRAIAYATYIGGSKNDFATAIAVNKSNQIFVTGKTFSPDFPITDNAFDMTCGTDDLCDQSNDMFLVELNPGKSQLSSLEYASYLGDHEWEDATGISLLNDQTPVIIASTISPHIATSDAWDTTCGTDGFCNAYDNKGVAADGLIAVVPITSVGVLSKGTRPEPPSNKVRVSRHEGGSMDGPLIVSLCLLILFARILRKTAHPFRIN